MLVAGGDGSRGEAVTLAQLELRLRTPGAVLGAHSGPTVLVVLLHASGLSEADEDAAIQRIDALVKTASGGNYVAVFGGDAPLASAAAAPRARRQQAAGPNGTDTGNDEEWINYFPSFVWAWLLVVVTLVTLFGLAIKATSELQVPPKLLTVGAAIHKKRV